MTPNRTYQAANPGAPKFETAAECIAQLREQLDKQTLWLDRGFMYQSNKPLKPMQRARLEAQADATGTAIEILIHNGNFSQERSESLARVRGEAPAPTPAPPADAEPAAKWRVCWRDAARVKYDCEHKSEANAIAAARLMIEGSDDMEEAGPDDIAPAALRASIVWIERQDPATKEWRHARSGAQFRIVWIDSDGREVVRGPVEGQAALDRELAAVWREWRAARIAPVYQVEELDTRTCLTEWRRVGVDRATRGALAAEYGAFRVAWHTHDGTLHHGGEGQEWNEARATAARDKLTAAGFKPAGATGDHLRGAAWIEHQDPTTKEWRQW